MPSTGAPEPRHTSRIAVEAALALAYFAFYLAWLFIHQENEFVHWATLVLFPLGGLWLLAHRRQPGTRFSAVLVSVGLDRANARTGLPLAIVVGLGLQVIPLLNAEHRGALVGLLHFPRGLLVVLLAFVLLLGTAACTEEVFFRGIVQTRLSDLFRSEWLGIAVTAILFAAYHVPYAWLDPDWPSYGNLSAAVRVAAANAIVGGLVLGWVFKRARRNLLASILVHALINLQPAMVLVDRLMGGRASLT